MAKFFRMSEQPPTCSSPTVKRRISIDELMNLEECHIGVERKLSSEDMKNSFEDNGQDHPKFKMLDMNTKFFHKILKFVSYNLYFMSIWSNISSTILCPHSSEIILKNGYIFS